MRKRFVRARGKEAAMTFVDVMLGAAITGMLLAALMTGSVLIQTQFGAATRFADSQSDQIRVMDFIEMDLRRATSVTIGTGATPLTLTVPNYYQTVSGKKQPRLPTKSGFNVQYDPTPVTTTYTLQGTNLIRTEGGVATTIATTVASFPPPVRTGKNVATTLTFGLKWKRSGATETVSLSSNTYLRNVN